MADVQESPAPAPEGVKVFVGNLSFQVGKEELEKEFADAGKVLSANIIMRGSRSRGYGFVEMATNEEAEKALSLNQREIDGRAINVELAKPREETPEAQQGEEGQEAQPRKARGRGRGRGGRGRGRRNRGRGGRGEGEGEAAPAEGGAEPAPPVAPEAAAEGAEGAEGADGEGGDRPRKRAARKGRSRAARGRGRGGRGRGAGKSEELREASGDTLFVANLPFATNDEELKNFFGEYNPSKAYVVVGRNGRSKGFGFVTFENDTDQQNALKLDGASLLERPVAVRVALNPEPQPEKAEEAEAEAAPAGEKAEEPEKVEAAENVD